MLGGEAPANDSEGASGNAALPDACRDVRERLEAIARALGALREDIDRVLEDTSARNDEGIASG